jgi:hypothetical protein
MSKYVMDTKAARALRAVVIMKGKRHVATIRAYFGQGGSCLVNVWQDSPGQLARPDTDGKWRRQTAHDRFQFQHGRATGYGYDKYAAALSGVVIDGHRMTDHCGDRLPYPKGKTLFPVGFKAPRGYSLANWNPRRVWNEETGGHEWQGEEGYMSCFRKTGTDYLQAIGYTVITVL